MILLRKSSRVAEKRQNRGCGQLGFMSAKYTENVKDLSFEAFAYVSISFSISFLDVVMTNETSAMVTAALTITTQMRHVTQGVLKSQLGLSNSLKKKLALQLFSVAAHTEISPQILRKSNYSTTIISQNQKFTNPEEHNCMGALQKKKKKRCTRLNDRNVCGTEKLSPLIPIISLLHIFSLNKC